MPYRLVICTLLLLARTLYSSNLGVIHPFLILGGSKGNSAEQFNEPDAVYFMHNGQLLAGDTVNGRVKVYDLPSNHSIKILGTQGTGDCQFDNSFVIKLPNGREIYNEVQGIVVNFSDEIFVVDQGNRRIVIFDSDGRCLPERTILLKGILVPPDPESGTTYTSIQGLAIDSDDNLYLTDTGTRRIYKFRKDGTPDSAFQFQVREKEEYILNDPESMIVVGEELHVADEGHHVIKVYDRKTGRFTGKTIGYPELFGRDVEGLAAFQNYLFAVDEEGGRIVIFNLAIKDNPAIGWFGEKGSEPGQFASADGIAISDDGKYLVVADQGNYRLQVFLLEEILKKVSGSKQ